MQGQMLNGIVLHIPTVLRKRKGKGGYEAKINGGGAHFYFYFLQGWRRPQKLAPPAQRDCAEPHSLNA